MKFPRSRSGPWFRRPRLKPGPSIALCALLLAGCRQDMHNAPRYEVFEASDSFADGRASRTPPAGTVARGWLREDEALHTGKRDGVPVEAIPFAVASQLTQLARA